MRREKLLMLYKEKLRRGELDRGTADSLTCAFLGYEACKAAFLLLTGIGSPPLMSAHDAARAGHESRLPQRE